MLLWMGTDGSMNVYQCRLIYDGWVQRTNVLIDRQLGRFCY